MNKSKILFSLLALSALLMLCSQSAMADNSTQEPAKDSNGFYLISTADELAWFADFVNTQAGDEDEPSYPNMGAKARLTADIAWNEGSFDTQGNWSEAGTPREWTPIGNYSNSENLLQFQGVFNGGGHTISGLYCKSSASYIGFVEYSNGATITNLGIVNNYFCSEATATDKGSHYAGGICGYVTGNTTITNCYCTGTIISQGNSGDKIGVGGICGTTIASKDYTTTISNCYFAGYVDTPNFTNRTGGIFGKGAGESTYATHVCLTNCYWLADAASVIGVSSEQNNNWLATNCSIKTATEFNCGEVAYLLNGNATNGIWGQELETQTAPVFSNEGIHYARTMKNQWGTIVLPYDVTIDEANDQYDFYLLSSVSSDVITLTKTTGTLPAGTPALLRRNAAVSGVNIAPASNACFATSPLGKSEGASSANGLTLTGSYVVDDITDNDGYIIANNAFWKISDIKGENKVYCSPFRAYLAGTLTASKLNIGFDDDTDGTERILYSLSTGEGWGEASIYDINGRRLNELQQGVNIVRLDNGKTKKIIIR